VRKPTRKGFTLIELTIMMLLVSVLVSIALPNFAAFRTRSHRAEVRTHIASISHAEFSYYGEHDAFTDDLKRLSWSLQGTPRYLYGFTSDISGSATNDTSEARANGHGDFTTAKMVDAFGILLTEGDLPAAVVTDETFLVGAAANLDWDATLDRWTMDQDGTITNVTDELTL
jgi:type IV pilus assembly protein PilE